MATEADAARADCIAPPDGIPMSIVKLNRWVLVVGILGGLIARQPLATTALFLVLLPAVLLGSRGSLIFFMGRRLFARRFATDEREDRRLMRFNNSIALLLLGAAQVAFLLDIPQLGWALALM